MTTLDTSTARKKIKAKDVFEYYFLKHHREDVLAILEEDDEEQHFSVTINFTILMDEHAVVAKSLVAQPVKLLPVLDAGLVCAASKLYQELCQDQPELSLKKHLHGRITELPNCPELYRHTVPHNCDVGRLLCVTGTVVRAGAPKMLEYQREFMCVKCKHVFMVKADHDQYYQLSKPARCPNPEGCYSFNYTAMGASSTPIFTRDYQEVKVQEQVQKLGMGTMPRSLWVTLEDDLVDSCKPGDDVLLCGTVHRRWRPLTRDCRPDIDLVLKANHVTVKNKQRSGTLVTDETREEFGRFWDHHRYDPLTGRNTILASFCPQVYGLYVVKLALAVVLAGGVHKTDTSATRIRGESHLLLVGDPGTGKSQFLKYVGGLVERCVLTTGVGTTHAGLTVAAVRDEGEWALEAGALVLADGAVCCIDEFGSVREADRAAIHEAMEQQTISVAKAGMVCKLNARCTIIAATNPKGEYDPGESLVVNTALASPLLSRFDLIFVLLDMKNHEWDKIVSSYILSGKDPLGRSGERGSGGQWSHEKLQEYLCHVRTLQPAMTQAANLVLTKYYQAQRRHDHTNQARTTIRLLESLVRLSQGHARLMMRTQVVVEDAVVAITLMEASVCGAALISGINPLHTAFPDSPRTEYKNQAQIILRHLCLLDQLTAEMTRINEEERLHKAWLASHPSVSPPPPPAPSQAPPTTSADRWEYQASVSEDWAPTTIVELEESEGRQRARKKQRTITEMASRKAETSVLDLDLDGTGEAEAQPQNKGKKNTKRKRETKGKAGKGKTRKKRNNIKDDEVHESPLNSQSLVDMACDELLKDMEDFESDMSRLKLLRKKGGAGSKGEGSSGSPGQQGAQAQAGGKKESVVGWKNVVGGRTDEMNAERNKDTNNIFDGERENTVTTENSELGNDDEDFFECDGKSKEKIGDKNQNCYDDADLLECDSTSQSCRSVQMSPVKTLTGRNNCTESKKSHKSNITGKNPSWKNQEDYKRNSMQNDATHKGRNSLMSLNLQKFAFTSSKAKYSMGSVTESDCLNQQETLNQGEPKTTSLSNSAAKLVSIDDKEKVNKYNNTSEASDASSSNIISKNSTNLDVGNKHQEATSPCTGQKDIDIHNINTRISPPIGNRKRFSFSLTENKIASSAPKHSEPTAVSSQEQSAPTQSSGVKKLKLPFKTPTFRSAPVLQDTGSPRLAPPHTSISARFGDLDDFDFNF